MCRKLPLTNEIHSCFLELDTEVTAVFRCLSAGLEFDAIQFHAYDEFGVGDTAMDLLNDLKDDSAAVLKRATVLVRAFVGGQ